MPRKEWSTLAPRLIEQVMAHGVVTMQVGSGRLFTHKKGYNLRADIPTRKLNPSKPNVYHIIAYCEMAEARDATHLCLFFDGDYITIECVEHVSNSRKALPTAVTRGDTSIYNCRKRGELSVPGTGHDPLPIYQADSRKQAPWRKPGDFPIEYRDTPATMIDDTQKLYFPRTNNITVIDSEARKERR